MFEAENLLLRRFVASGDSEAFSEIVRRHAGLVYGACLRILQDRDKAADAVQETFFQLLRNAGSITGSVPCWLHRVATRRAIDRIRKDSTRRQREIRYAADKPREVRQWEDISPYVDEELGRLDEQTREILIRHFFEGRTTREIGGSMRVSQATVSRRIEAGVGRLRERLRRRGIMVAVGALSALLGENAAEAAPALVMKELGKMALVGGQAAAASAAGSATAAAAGAGAKVAASGAAAGLKVKVITAAAVAAVGVGSVATLHYTSGPSDKSTSQQVVEDVDESTPRSTPLSRRQQRSARSSTIQQAPEMPLAEFETRQGYPGMRDPRSFEEMLGLMGGEAMAGAQQTEPTAVGGFAAAPTGGMMMGAARSSASSAQESQDPAPMQVAFYGYGGMTVARSQPRTDPNDSNDRSSDDE